jgi:hypothetical protein
MGNTAASIVDLPRLRWLAGFEFLFEFLKERGASPEFGAGDEWQAGITDPVNCHPACTIENRPLCGEEHQDREEFLPRINGAIAYIQGILDFGLKSNCRLQIRD